MNSQNEIEQYIGLLAVSFFTIMLTTLEKEQELALVKIALSSAKIYDNIKYLLKSKDSEFFMNEISQFLSRILYNGFDLNIDKEIIDCELIKLVCWKLDWFKNQSEDTIYDFIDSCWEIKDAAFIEVFIEYGLLNHVIDKFSRTNNKDTYLSLVDITQDLLGDIMLIPQEQRK